MPLIKTYRGPTRLSDHVNTTPRLAGAYYFGTRSDKCDEVLVKDDSGGASVQTMLFIFVAENCVAAWVLRDRRLSIVRPIDSLGAAAPL